MGEVIRFIPKAERERIRLMQEIRAMYDGAILSSDSSATTRQQLIRSTGPRGTRATKFHRDRPSGEFDRL
jgi:hypothetical protein